MRRLLIALVLCMILITTVSAAGSVQDLQSNTAISSDGTCEVTVTAQLRLDGDAGELYFPVPAAAIDITLNGDRVYPALSDGMRKVDLEDAVPSAGVATFVIRYSLPDSVAVEKSGQLRLKLELMSGFAYPVEKASFSVSLPGVPESEPAFTSTYYQEAIDSLMACKITDNVIALTFENGLQDHETLSMTLAVTNDMFPQPISKLWQISTDDVAMTILAILALLYWGLTMRCLPPRRIRRAKEPEGITAGELGCCLTGQGVDFTMTVLSWAQMGYLRIQPDGKGHVLLHKRMDMGNERSDWEVRYFSALFGRRKTIDATGPHYARLCLKAAKARPHIRDYYQNNSGNPVIFRVLCAGIGLFGGISLAAAFVADTALLVILSVLLAPLGTVASWLIQSGAAVIHLRHWRKSLIGAACGLFWLLLGIWAQEWGVAAFVVATQWLAGLMTAYGGRRSEAGKQTMSQILGLRRHMTKAFKGELLHILERNPEYYYALAPYAMALGVDQRFARRFGDRELPECTYLTTGRDGRQTAREWNQHLRSAVEAMDARKRRLPWENLFKK